MKKSLKTKVEGTVASVALTLGLISCQSSCYFLYHQPKIPKAMSKFKK